MLELGLKTGLLRRRRGPISISVTGPLTFSAGRKTLTGVDLTTADATGGTVTGSPTTLTLGTSTVGTGAHWTTNGANVQTAAVPTDATYTWTGCTMSDGVTTSAGFTLTITTVANQYTCDSNASVEAATAACAPTTDTFALTKAVESLVDVVGVFGQSNAEGHPLWDSGTDYDAAALCVDTNGDIRKAYRNLWHVVSTPTDISFAVTFSQSWATNNPTRVLLFVPNAAGGTGFVDNEWNPGDTEYEAALSLWNGAFTDYPTASALGVLWHQGEEDLQNSGEAAYNANFDAMLADFRSRATQGTNLPWVVGTLSPNWSVATTAFQEKIYQAGYRNAYVWCVDTTGTVESELTDTGNNVHYTAVDLRLMGTRYWNNLQTAEANTTSGWPAPTVTGGTDTRTLNRDEVMVTYAVSDEFSIVFDSSLVGVTGYAITSGALPTGLSLNTTTGDISGTPTVDVTNQAFTVTATVTGGLTAAKDYSWTVEEASIPTDSEIRAILDADANSGGWFPKAQTGLVNNPDFAADVSDWTATGTSTLTHSSGTMEVAASGSLVGGRSNAITTVIGRNYWLSGDITAGTGGYIGKSDSATAWNSNWAGIATNAGVGSYSDDFAATATTSYIHCIRASAGTTNFDNIYLIDAEGPDAVASPNDTPVFDITDPAKPFTPWTVGEELIISPATTSAYAIMMRIRSSSTYIIPVSDDSAGYCIAAQDGNSGAFSNNSGTVTVIVDGVTSSGTTRDDMHTEICDGSWHTVEALFDPTLWTKFQISGFVGNFDLAGIIFCTQTVRTNNLTDFRNYLADLA